MTGSGSLATSPNVRTSAVVFDLDGTLLDTMTLAPTAYVDTISALGGPDVSPADVVAAWHIGSTPVVLSHFLGRPTSTRDLECFNHHFEVAIAPAQPFPGVLEMVDTLSRRGHRLGVFTSATKRSATLMLAKAGLDGRLPTVVCGDEISRPKPAPQGLLLACQRLGVSADVTAYVGDAEVDLQCARAAGALPVHASWCPSATAIEGFPLVAHHPDDVSELLRQASVANVKDVRSPAGL